MKNWLDKLVNDWYIELGGYPDYSNSTHRLVLENMVKRKYSILIERTPQVNSELLLALKKFNKERDWESFVKSLPASSSKLLIDYINSVTVTKEMAEEFASKLYSKKSLDQVNSSDWQSGVGNILFSFEKVGYGRGELNLAWILKNSELPPAGAQSFDLKIGSQKYEVKDYSNKSQSIRLGTEGTANQFEFWREILRTGQFITDLLGLKNINDIFNAQTLKIFNIVSSRYSSKWASGEFGKKDMDDIKNIYQILQKFTESGVAGYNQVTFRGPNIKPITKTIAPVTNIDSDPLTLDFSDSEANLEQIITGFRRLKYVRNPNDLDIDLMTALDSLTADGKVFIIYRNGKITLNTKFKFERISQGKIKVWEI